MVKNPVFEFLKQQGAFQRLEPSHGPIEYVPPFSYRGDKLRSESAVLDVILANPHPTDVLVDSSLFGASRINLVRQLLIRTALKILPEVRDELAELANRPTHALKDVLFPDGELNSRLEPLAYSAVERYAYATSRYVNLLHLRTRFLEVAMKPGTKGKERHKIIQDLLNRGFSWRTVRLANKDKKRRRYTDEVLVVYGVFSPILTGRDCFILTADQDVFDQFYQFTVLLHDDYGSFLIGEDYRQNPERYPHSHPWTTPFMQAGAITIGRALEPVHLLPKIQRTCATYVIDVSTLHFMAWVSIREIEAALAFQEGAADGRVGNGGNGMNVHVSLGDSNCKAAPQHFTIGQDHVPIEKGTIAGRIRISEFDLYRVTRDKKVSKTASAKDGHRRS